MSKTKTTEPKDLGLKVGTKLEVLWTEMEEKVGNGLLQLEKEIIVQKALLQLCHDKIKQELTE